MREDLGSSDIERARKIGIGGYDSVSRVWDRYFVPMTEPIRAKLLELAMLKPGEIVLDIGTGTGRTAILAARQVQPGIVVGIDSSQGMLRKARSNARRSGTRNARFLLMNSSTPSFPKRTFDALISSFGATEGVHDAVTVLKGWLRVLVPGGRLCFCEGLGSTKLWETLTRAFEVYKVKDPSPRLAARRRLTKILEERKKRVRSFNWAHPQKMRDLIRQAGFKNAKLITQRYPLVFPSRNALLDLFFSWDLSDEYKALPTPTRRKFGLAIQTALSRFESKKGLKTWARVTFYSGIKE